MVEAKPIAVLFIILLAIVTLFFISKILQDKFEPALEHSAWEAQCENSFRMNALSGSEIKCPELNITIPDDISKPAGQDAAKTQTANTMKECLDFYKAGKLFDKETVYCHPCANIDFKVKNIKFGHFTEKLAEKIPGTDISFLDYFAGYETPKFKELISNPNIYNVNDARLATEFDSNKKYEIVITYVKGTEEIQKWAEALGTSRQVVSFSRGAFWGGALATGTIIFLGSNPIGWTASGIIALSALAFGARETLLDYFKDKPDAWIRTISLVEWEPGILQKLGCKELPVGFTEK